jgi:hypothetical protein
MALPWSPSGFGLITGRGFGDGDEVLTLGAGETLDDRIEEPLSPGGEGFNSPGTVPEI